MKLLSKRSSSRTSITARSINEGKELSYQMLYNEVQRLADEEANKKKKKKIYVYKSDVSKSQSYVPKYDPENFNLMKRIKEIRKVTKENNMDITKQNSNIAFAKDKIDIVPLSLSEKKIIFFLILYYFTKKEEDILSFLQI